MKPSSIIFNSVLTDAQASRILDSITKDGASHKSLELIPPIQCPLVSRTDPDRQILNINQTRKNTKRSS
jgi:hypothetical protein